MQIHADFEALFRRYPLPPDFSLVEQLVDRTTLGPWDLHMVGLLAQGQAGEAVGAAADFTAAPLHRAYYELLERTYTLQARKDAPLTYPLISRDGTEIGHVGLADVFPSADPASRFVPSTSNGIALHSTAAAACDNALLELFERHATLSAWYGYTSPQVPALSSSLSAPLTQLGYQLHIRVFPTPAASNVAVVGLLAEPGRADLNAPLLFSSGGGKDEAEALASAERELLQRVAFLWDEPLPESSPDFSPDVDYHQAYHLVRDHRRLLLDFFQRGHTHLLPKEAKRLAFERGCGEIRFARLSPADCPLTVVRALGENMLPLRFGEDPAAAHLPAALRIHPIS